ncbi:MAG: hypothetical protein SVY15_00370 [Halobacteriota archaeon]|nr:hypothetical protein [Halobacteriota archaeon]
MGYKIWSIYVFVFGALCLFLGSMEVASVPLGIDSVVPADLFGGFVMFVTGAVYLSGLDDLLSERQEGLSFAIVGTLLLAVFGILYLLVIGADGLMYLIGGAEEFSFASGFRPEIWLFAASLPAAIYIVRGREDPGRLVNGF